MLGVDCVEEWKKDGQCDDINNKALCAFDEGDCCGTDAVNQYCFDCSCLSNKRHSFLLTCIYLSCTI